MSRSPKLEINFLPRCGPQKRIWPRRRENCANARRSLCEWKNIGIRANFSPTFIYGQKFATKICAYKAPLTHVLVLVPCKPVVVLGHYTLRHNIDGISQSSNTNILAKGRNHYAFYQAYNVGLRYVGMHKPDTAFLIGGNVGVWRILQFGC